MKYGVVFVIVGLFSCCQIIYGFLSSFDAVNLYSHPVELSQFHGAIIDTLNNDNLQGFLTALFSKTYGIDNNGVFYHDLVTDANGNTLLMEAVKQKANTIVAYLLGERAVLTPFSYLVGDRALLHHMKEVFKNDLVLHNVDKKNNQGQTALMIACQHHNVKAVELLLKHGADITVKDNQNNSCLWYLFNSIDQLLSQNDTKVENIVKMLFENGMDPNSKLAIENSPTLLMMVVRFKLNDTVRYLLSLKNKDTFIPVVDRTLTDDEGYTALMYAVEENNTDGLQLLLNDPYVRSLPRLLNAQNKAGETVLDLIKRTKRCTDFINQLKQLGGVRAVADTTIALLPSRVQHPSEHGIDIVDQGDKYSHSSFTTTTSTSTQSSSAAVISTATDSAAARSSSSAAVSGPQQPLSDKVRDQQLSLWNNMIDNTDIQNIESSIRVYLSQYGLQEPLNFDVSRFNNPAENKRTILMDAVLHNNRPLIEWLFRHQQQKQAPGWSMFSQKSSANTVSVMHLTKIINNKDTRGDTALSYAVGMVCRKDKDKETNISNIVEYLVNNGAAVDHAVLKQVVSCGNDRLVELFINTIKKRGPDKDISTIINESDSFGDTLLMYGVLSGNPRVVTLLLAHGAAINHQNSLGDTPLIKAVRGGNPAMIETLLSYKPMIKDKKRGEQPLSPLDVSLNINKTNNEGDTALHSALSQQHVVSRDHIVDLLLRHGIDVNSANNKGQTPLMIAAATGASHLVDHFLTKYPTIDINMKDKNGNTALMLAACGGHDEVVSILLRNQHVQIDQENSAGDTALVCAVKKKHIPVIEQLLRAGADYRLMNNNQNAFFFMNADQDLKKHFIDNDVIKPEFLPQQPPSLVNRVKMYGVGLATSLGTRAQQGFYKGVGGAQRLGRHSYQRLMGYLQQMIGKKKK